MSEENKPHFWISDNEVIEVHKELTSRSSEVDIVYSEHGSKLSSSLQKIEEEITKSSSVNSLANTDTMVFKIEVSDGDKIQYKDSEFEKLGLVVNAVKSEKIAIVTTTKQKFEILKQRVQTYTRNGE